MISNIEITEEIKNEAAQFQSRMRGRGQYTRLDETDRYYHGRIGELAVRDLFDFHDKQYVFDPPSNRWQTGNYKPDFIIYMAYGTQILEKTVDVKTASKDWYRKLMFPKVQSSHGKSGKYDYYIGTRIKGSTVEVLGWCYYSDLVEEMYKVPTMTIELDKLRSIHELIGIML